MTNTLLQKWQYRNTIQNLQKHAMKKKKNKITVAWDIPGLTNNHNLKQLINTNNIIPAYKPNKTLNAIFTNTKSKIDKLKQNNVVYKIKCLGNAEQQCG